MSSSKDSFDIDVDYDAPCQPNRISVGRAALLLAAAALATFLTVFSAVGAALARHHASHLVTNSLQSAGIVPAHVQHHTDIIAEPQHTSCGHSPAEARSRGCSFDISSFAWLTAECYDDALTQDFIQWSNWSWYLGEEPTDDAQITFEQAVLGEQDTFVDWKYHMTHCTFMWRLQHLSIEKGWVARHLVHYNHTIHCQHALLMEDGEHHHALRTPARVVYPPCLRVGADEPMYPGSADRASISW